MMNVDVFCSDCGAAIDTCGDAVDQRVVGRGIGEDFCVGYEPIFKGLILIQHPLGGD